MLARDNASKTFRDIGDSADRAGKRGEGFGSSISGAMKVAAGAIAAAGIGRAFAGFVQDAQESAKISRLTEQVVKSTGGAAQITADQVNALATSISNKTAVDDEAVQSASNLLLTFTKVRNETGKGNDIFNQATQAAVDMSVALGTDANGAALQLGKALNDPIKGVSALSRAGVSFTAQQKEQIKAMVEAGDTLGAQKIILGEMQVQFGGAAAAAASPLDRLKVIAGNLGEQIGGSLLPHVEKFADFITDTAIPTISRLWGWLSEKLSPVFSEIVGGIRAFAAAWIYNDGEITSSGFPGFMERLGYIARQVFDYMKDTVIPALADFAGWVGRNKDIILPFVAALGAAYLAFQAFMFIKSVIAAVAAFNAVLLANPIGLVIAAIAAMVAILVIAYQRSDTFRAIVDGAFRAVATAGKWMWENVLKPAFNGLMTAWDAVGSAIRWTFNNVIAPIFNGFSRLITTVKDGFGAAVDGIGRMWDGIKAKLRAPVQWVIDVVWNNGLRALWNTANNLWGGTDIKAFSFATGGYTGAGAKYQPAGIVHAGEYVFTQEQVKQLGVDNLEALANGAKLPGYAGGGIVTLPGWLSTALKFLPGGGAISAIADKVNGSIGGQGGGQFGSMVLGLAKALGAKVVEKALDLFGGGNSQGVKMNGGPLGAGALGGSWRSIANAVQAIIPQARVNSAFRPGDPGYHGRGKAVDFGFGTGPGGNGSAGLASINRLLHDRFGSNLAELIYDGLGDDRPDLKNGRPLTYSAGTRAAHRNHVHAAVYDGGGLLPPGLTMAYNGTGRNETIRTAEQERALAGPAVFHLYDSDGVLMGTMRGQAESVVVGALTGASDRGRYNG